jgi:hypothetical protein
MNFRKFSFKSEVEWTLIISLLPLILGILVALAIMILSEFDLINLNR